MKVEEKTEEIVNAYGVAWGHYEEKSMPVTDTLGTDSLGSCFAFIRIDKKKKKVFFAHVSSDGETKYLLDQKFEKSNILTPPNQEIQYLYVKGSGASSGTNKRITDLTNKYGGKEYDKRDYTGVALSPFKSDDAKITITHCKKITASNNDDYKKKTETAQQWKDDHGLEPM